MTLDLDCLLGWCFLVCWNNSTILSSSLYRTPSFHWNKKRVEDYFFFLLNIAIVIIFSINQRCLQVTLNHETICIFKFLLYLQLDQLETHMKNYLRAVQTVWCIWYFCIFCCRRIFHISPGRTTGRTSVKMLYATYQLVTLTKTR